MNKKKLISTLLCFSLILLCFKAYTDANSDNWEPFYRLKLVSLRTVSGTVSDPDIFFEGTKYEHVKPTKMLDWKFFYNKPANMSNMYRSSVYKPNGKKKIDKALYGVEYTIHKDPKKDEYVFNFDKRLPTSKEDREIFKNNITEKTWYLTNINDLQKNVKSAKNLANIKEIIKIDACFTKDEFDALPKKVLQENNDFVQALVLFNNCYMYVRLLKIKQKGTKIAMQ